MNKLPRFWLSADGNWSCKSQICGSLSHLSTRNKALVCQELLELFWQPLDSPIGKKNQWGTSSSTISHFNHSFSALEFDRRPAVLSADISWAPFQEGVSLANSWWIKIMGESRAKCGALQKQTAIAGPRVNGGALPACEELWVCVEYSEWECDSGVLGALWCLLDCQLVSV